MDTAQSRPFRGLVVAVTLSCLSIGAVVAKQRSCVGDCDGDCRVVIDEIVGGICLHLSAGGFWCRPCEAHDANCNGTIAVNELIQGVNNLLNGCAAACVPGAWSCTPPAESPTATPTPTVTATATLAPKDPLLEAIADVFADQGDCQSMYAMVFADAVTVYCVWGPGHDSKVSLQRRTSGAEAAAAVASFADNGGEIELFGSPAYLWEEQFPSGFLEFNYRYLKARIGCWFLAAQSFDDTIYRYAYHPLEMSAVVADAFTEELLSRCE